MPCNQKAYANDDCNRQKYDLPEHHRCELPDTASVSTALDDLTHWGLSAARERNTDRFYLDPSVTFSEDCLLRVSDDPESRRPFGYQQDTLDSNVLGNGEPNLVAFLSCCG